MLHATRLLALGQVLAVVDDDGAAGDLNCGDRDSAFVLIAESADDVFAFVDRDERPATENNDDTAKSRSAESEDDDLEEYREPLRFYFFCANEDDRYWLHGACLARQEGIGLAAIEICPITGEGVCHVRVPRGVRVIRIISAE